MDGSTALPAGIEEMISSAFGDGARSTSCVVLKEWARAEHVDSPPTVLYEQAIAENVLAGAESRAADRGAHRMERLMERGDPTKRILEEANRCAVDVIVMGTRGLSDLQGLVMGSVAHKVTHAAGCTVVTVR